MLAWKRGRRVLVCVTGGIAAYKIPDLVSRLRKLDCEVEVVLTEAAEALVSPLALSTLSGRRTWRQGDFLSASLGFEIPHISLAKWAEVVVVAPCTADTAFGIAHGRADSIVEAATLATRAPVVLFPAMNSGMLDNPATQRNLTALRDAGIRVVDPDFGRLACGGEGKGRLPDSDVIMEEIFLALSPHKDMAGKHVLVTAGPTWEFIDPVRFISNPSSGKMGIAMARTAWYRGAEARVVLGPGGGEQRQRGCTHGLEIVNVVSAVQMRDAVMSSLSWSDYVVKAAAVGDYRVKEMASRKIKREGCSEMTVELVQNPDIAAEVGAAKRPGQVIIGFAAETHDAVSHAKEKMRRKNLDAIVVNDVSVPGAGFGCDTNAVRIIFADSREGEAEAEAEAEAKEITASGDKEDVADAVWGTSMVAMVAFSSRAAP
ncbi:MAG: bifunctional phosphopantothenoylcysteine decarboxylase/phosphopantothenate--cysteine ligase CoaBC [Synergistaceae bacterium]|jgi:phosphopantothenoylcysteine decarboxylase/phosphopantothenate--cysteine ligase|nr:bifunctional phosphopantothenoylcysteine decarboxylase/phosphopantothenate--cysteine ligase CoaBC [Synergistaceae bacterium]